MSEQALLVAWITLQSKVRTEEYPSLNLIPSTILLLKWETQLGILVTVICSPNILYSFIWITLWIESPARRTKRILHKMDKGFPAWCKRSPQNIPHSDPRTPVGFLSHRGARAAQQAAGNTTLLNLLPFSDSFYLASILPACRWQSIWAWIIIITDMWFYAHSPAAHKSSGHPLQQRRSVPELTVHVFHNLLCGMIEGTYFNLLQSLSFTQ